MLWIVPWKGADTLSAEKEALERLKKAEAEDWLAALAAWAVACSARAAKQTE